MRRPLPVRSLVARMCVVCGALGSGGCDAPASAPGPPGPSGGAAADLVLNELAPLQAALGGAPADWIEICVRSAGADLTDYTVRAEVPGGVVVLHTFGAGTSVPAGGRLVLGPPAMGAEVAASLDIPATPGTPMVVRLLDPAGKSVDAFGFVLDQPDPAIVARPWDCQTDRTEVQEVLMLPEAGGTPGEPGPGDTECLMPDGPPEDDAELPTYDIDAQSEAAEGEADVEEDGPQPSETTLQELPYPTATGCHTLYPVDAAGHVWTYDLAIPGSGGQQVYKTLGPGAGGGHAMSVETTLDDGTTVSYTNTLVCVDDVLSLEVVDATSVVGGVALHSTTTFTPPLMLLDADPTAGHSFTQSFSLTATTELPPPVGPMSYTADGEQTVTIEALEEVTVPFGTFTSRRVVQKVTVMGQTETSKFWYVLGVGLVRSDGPPPPGTPPQAGLKTLAWELVSFAP